MMLAPHSVHLGHVLQIADEWFGDVAGWLPPFFPTRTERLQDPSRAPNRAQGCIDSDPARQLETKPIFWRGALSPDWRIPHGLKRSQVVPMFFDPP